MEALIDVLEIDSRSRLLARRIWPLIESRSATIVDAFYAGAGHFAVEPSRALHAVECLKVRQRDHWKNLFEGRFDEDYFRSASLLGIRHCEMGFDSKWHVVAYARMKRELAGEIQQSPLPAASKTQLLVILDKYLALDLAISLSSYACVLLD